MMKNKSDVQNLPLLSVIVPAYETEETIGRCLDSILHCSYRAVEVIVVNDKSPGHISEIVRDYQRLDSRVKLVEHEVNKGLFHARMSGVAASEGKYIAFVDSDDHVSVDLYRRLIEKAEATESDMVFGEVYLQYDNEYEYYNLSHTRLLDVDAYGEEASKILFEQTGRDFTLHTACNKIYRRDLWEKCKPYFELQKNHLGMCEDVFYSTFFFYFASHVTNIHGDFLYYVKSSNSLTGITNKDVNKYIKNVKDIKNVCSLIEHIFKEVIKDETYIGAIREWKRLLMTIWLETVERLPLKTWEKQKLLHMIREELPEGREFRGKDFFYTITTRQNFIGNENLKERIVSQNCEVVSFDIFDTLVYRPFWTPSDLFSLLGGYVNRLLDTTDFVDFKELRVTAEQVAREKNKVAHPSWEEITLDDIYDVIQDYMGLTDDERQKIQEKEIQMEISYCLPRDYAKELFELCLACGKRIVITSDMYLPKSVIEEILHKCGYDGYERLFLSGEIKLGKWSGHLFDYLVRELNVSSKKVLHIGDTLFSDVETARKCGLQSVHFPKAVDRLMNLDSAMYGGELFKHVYASPFALRDGLQFERYLGLKCALAVAANRIFSNPYLQFNLETDFNADPTIIGYMAVGMHMFAVAQWLAEEIKIHGYRHMNFIARDGYLPMKCFHEINYIYRLDVKTDYLYLTRSVMLPLQMRKPYDVFSMIRNVNIYEQTPRKIFEGVRPIIRQNVYAEKESFCERHGILIDKKFPSVAEFCSFLEEIKEELVDSNKIQAYKEMVYTYLKPAFSAKSATFDVGYSCRVESFLKRNFSFDVTPYYIHINNDMPLYRSERAEMPFHTFYRYSPGVTGIFRELILSAQAPSCQALEWVDGEIKPIFKPYEQGYAEHYVLTAMQDSAVQYVKDIVRIFGDDIRHLYYQREDMSLPFEYYNACSKIKDRQIFQCSDFEDEMGLGEGALSTFDFWNRQVENVAAGVGNTMDLSLHWIPKKWQRAICLYFMDRNYLKYKVKVKLEHSPAKLAFITKSYRGLRAVYRRLKRL